MTWEPQWAVKVRLKSVANAMLGMDSMGMQSGPEKGAAGRPGQDGKEQSGTDKAVEGIGQGLNKLKGVFGF